MKRLVFILLVVCSLSWCVPAGAQMQKVNTSRTERKLRKKQQKAQRKAAKAQRRGERRMQKIDRKNTHDPNMPKRR
jgi:Ni/Co efflux regulator RcnB